MFERLLKDINKVWLLYLKAFLLFLTGFISSILLVLLNFNVKTIVLLFFAIWGFCRAYYFAFYVIQHYVDPNYKFSGLIDFAKYSIRKGKSNLKKKKKIRWDIFKRLTETETIKKWLSVLRKNLKKQKYLINLFSSKYGGGGIRTHGTLADTLVFKTRALNHSTTPPGKNY